MLHTDRNAPQAAQPQDVYVLAAHPAWRDSRVNFSLMNAAVALPRVRVQDLYSSYPDYAIDVHAEQAALARATRGVAAPDSVVFDACSAKALAGRRTDLRLGLR